MAPALRLGHWHGSCASSQRPGPAEVSEALCAPGCKQVLRGENVVLMGEIDEARDPPLELTRVGRVEGGRAGSSGCARGRSGELGGLFMSRQAGEW